MTMNTQPIGRQGETAGQRQEAVLYLVRALSPVHVGVGEGIGAINLPTAREVLTGYPLVPGSSAKGVLRDYAEYRHGGAQSEEVWTAFGPDYTRAADARGGLVISDANLPALPIRSLYGIFAWATCPFIVRRLSADAREAGLGGSGVAALAALASDGDQTPRVSNTACRLLPEGKGERLFLEDRPLDKVQRDRQVGSGAAWIADGLWPNQGRGDAGVLRRALAVVLPDDLFGFFSRSALEVRQRVKINPETGTAATSGPWSEELMPAETLLHGLALGRTTVFVPERAVDGTAGPNRPKRLADGLAVLRNLLSDTPLPRFGGKSSGGSGRVHMRLVEAPARGTRR